MRKPVEIRFGDIHTYHPDNKLRYVIVDVGQDDWFVVCQIVEENERLGSAGTGKREHIAEIIGNMGFEQIIEGIEKTMGSVSEKMANELRKSSLKPPRILK